MELYKCQKSKKYKLMECPEDTLLTAIGVRNGILVEVITKQPLGGPIIIRIGQRDIALDKKIAQRILAEVSI